MDYVTDLTLSMSYYLSEEQLTWNKVYDNRTMNCPLQEVESYTSKRKLESLYLLSVCGLTLHILSCHTYFRRMESYQVRRKKNSDVFFSPFN